MAIITGDGIRKRKASSTQSKKDSTSAPDTERDNEDGKEDAEEDEDTKEARAMCEGFVCIVWSLVGVFVMFILSFKYATYLHTLLDNKFWFSNIKEVEREISFRTEAGLYYSYFKQLVHSNSISNGIQQLSADNSTEHGHTINIISRFNIFPEILLGAFYKAFNVKTMLPPIFFYVRSVFALHGCYLAAIFFSTWLLSDCWLSGVLASCFFVANRVDSTRVDYTAPLRESFALPFIYWQMLCVTCYLRQGLSARKQLILLYGVQVCALLATCALQYFNTMILGSLLISLVPISLLVLFIHQTSRQYNVVVKLIKAGVHFLALIIMSFGANSFVKNLLNLDADEHVFKFLLGKFGFGDPKDFESRLYLCNGAFKFMDFDIAVRLTKNLLLPLYCLVLCVVLGYTVWYAIEVWRGAIVDKKSEKESDNLDLAYHAVQSVLYGGMAVVVVRFKYVWLPSMCVLAAAGLGSRTPYAWLQRLLFTRQKAFVSILRYFMVALFIGGVCYVSVPDMQKELENLREFYDPDTVQLMTWISKKTPENSAFAGSMQLLAGVKLCTGRHITNHPHFEDKWLRNRTIQVYQVYGRKSAKDVHEIMTGKVGADYVILEDSICKEPPKADGSFCRTPDLVDLENFHIPEKGKEEEGLTKTNVPRFCERVRIQQAEYSKFFKLVFHNHTFRVYQVVKKKK